MKDRVLLLGGLAALALGLLGLLFGSTDAWPPAALDWLRPRASAAVVPPWEDAATGRVREFRLTIGRTRWELAPGNVVEAYAYDGQVPGPELRVTEGDTVRVTVTNELQEPTTIHWHGVEVPVGMDGVPQLSQEPVPPGGAFTYEFVATPPGTRWYHSHFNELPQQGGGLVGALIVEPQQPAGPAADREYTLVTGQLVTAAGVAQQPPAPTPAAGGRMTGGMMGSGSGRPLYDTFFVNGKAYPHTPPLVVRPGERVRLRLINAGVTETQAFALAGHRLTITPRRRQSPGPARRGRGGALGGGRAGRRRVRGRTPRPLAAPGAAAGPRRARPGGRRGLRGPRG
ncbi:MAG: hypothetical protein KatS3mg060_2319 [Dehalococcoidia bacterium]|nr:MAG: hypothetical protein KatS3mg060_2319 [Dehalococcoidia bacterium]